MFFSLSNSFSVCEHVKRNVIISLQVILSGLVNLSLSVLFRKFYFIMYWMENWSTHFSQTFQAFLSDLSYLSVCSVTTVDCTEWLVENLLVVGNNLMKTLIHMEYVLFCSSQISLDQAEVFISSKLTDRFHTDVWISIHTYVEINWEQHYFNWRMCWALACGPGSPVSYLTER